MHLWQYLTHFFLEWETFGTKVVVKINNPLPPPPEYRAIYDMTWKKYCSTGRATDDSIIRRMRFACWMTNAANTPTEYVMRIARSCTRLSITLYVHCLSCLQIAHTGCGAHLAPWPMATACSLRSVEVWGRAVGCWPRSGAEVQGRLSCVSFFA